LLHRLQIGWTQSLTDSYIFSAVLGVSCFIAVTIYRYYQPGSRNRIYRLIFAVCITVMCCVAFKNIVSEIYSHDEAYLRFVEQSMPVRFIFSLLMLSFVGVVNWVYNNVRQQKEQERLKNETESLLKEAELVKLRQQLQPHFLFNSLNSISALAGSDPAQARKMIHQLSDFLRGTMKKDENSTVKLREELRQLELYLSIEKVRFGDRLNVEIDCDDVCQEKQVPPLLLQPVVENAIKFGLYGTLGEITVKIACACEENFLTVTVSNPFDSTSASGTGTGFGLNSVGRRLQLMYSRNDLLNIVKKEKEFITSLKIPQA
jgi:two-component system, LytTR family, sensor kinase